MSQTQKDIQHVVVIGSGTMGAGIAQWLAQHSVQVELVDLHFENAVEAIKKIHLYWESSLQKGKWREEEVNQFKKNILPQEINNINPESDLVIEAIIEDLKCKKELFTTLDAYFAAHTIFATNTSSFSISQLCAHLPLKRRKNFLGLHFFNPAPILKLVEIITGATTDPSLSQKLALWLKNKGKNPAICQDRPGFIVNRVARNFYGEPMRIAGRWDEETLTNIDNIMKKVGGFKMGPFELMDFIGIDINFTVTQSVWTSFFYHPRFAPHFLQQQAYLSGKFGKKSGEGFYNYDKV